MATATDHANTLCLKGIPVLEGESARRFLKDAKANEKKRGSMKSAEADASFRAIIEKAKKLGTLPFI